MTKPVYIKSVFIVLALMLLSACGHDAPVRSLRQEQAIEFNQHAQRAFQRGEYQAAASLYENALQLDTAIENVDGIAVNLLNLSRVNQELGKAAVAQQYLDRILQDKALLHSPVHLASAAVQYGLLRLQAGDISAARSWADKATDYCVSDCKISGVIANLQANIALASGDAEQAGHWSERGVSINKADSQTEYANSLRLQAQSKLMKQDINSVMQLLEEVLAIDKSLGMPDKIRQDLLLMAQTQGMLGHDTSAAQYRERAGRISATLVR
jgi:tetratricopeptide (TPR) repeat protein